MLELEFFHLQFQFDSDLTLRFCVDTDKMEPGVYTLYSKVPLEATKPPAAPPTIMNRVSSMWSAIFCRIGFHSIDWCFFTSDLQLRFGLTSCFKWWSEVVLLVYCFFLSPLPLCYQPRQPPVARPSLPCQQEQALMCTIWSTGKLVRGYSKKQGDKTIFWSLVIRSVAKAKKEEWQ